MCGHWINEGYSPDSLCVLAFLTVGPTFGLRVSVCLSIKPDCQGGRGAGSVGRFWLATSLGDVIFYR